MWDTTDVSIVSQARVLGYPSTVYGLASMPTAVAGSTLGPIPRWGTALLTAGILAATGETSLSVALLGYFLCLQERILSVPTQLSGYQCLLDFNCNDFSSRRN